MKCLQKLASEQDLNTVESIKKNSLEVIKSKILDANMQYLTYVTDKYTNYMLNR